MPIFSIEDFAENINKKKRLMALDLGSKTIGLAIGDLETGISSALHTIQRKKFTADITELKKWLADYEIGGLVIGMPKNMDGTEGRRCQSTKDFTAELDRFLDGTYPICYCDERLSTFEAETFLIDEVDMSRSKREAIIDKMAAQNIMATALSYFARNA